MINHGSDWTERPTKCTVQKKTTLQHPPTVFNNINSLQVSTVRSKQKTHAARNDGQEGLKVTMHLLSPAATVPEY